MNLNKKVTISLGLASSLTTLFTLLIFLIANPQENQSAILEELAFALTNRDNKGYFRFEESYDFHPLAYPDYTYNVTIMPQQLVIMDGSFPIFPPRRTASHYTRQLVEMVNQSMTRDNIFIFLQKIESNLTELNNRLNPDFTNIVADHFRYDFTLNDFWNNNGIIHYGTYLVLVVNIDGIEYSIAHLDSRGEFGFFNRSNLGEEVPEELRVQLEAYAIRVINDPLYLEFLSEFHLRINRVVDERRSYNELHPLNELSLR